MYRAHIRNAGSTSIRREAERGVVLIYAVLGLMLVAGIVVAGSMRDLAHEKSATLEFEIEGQARQLAESGIVDGIAWLRSRETQPVTDFAPSLDLKAKPRVDETDDPSRGLVRELEISRGYWGRYVVHLSSAAEPFSDSNRNGVFDPSEGYDDTNGNGRRDEAGGSRDVSALRGVETPGIVWYLESTGSIYRRYDEKLPLGEGRNARLAQMTVGTEVRRLTVVIPASAAVVVSNGKKAKIEGTYVNSPVLGVAYRTGKFKYKTKSKDEHRIEFDAPSKAAKVPSWLTSGVGDGDSKRIRVEDVFGVGISTLKMMADYSVEGLSGIGGLGTPVVDPVIEDVAGVITERLPYTIPDGAFVVITPPSGTLVFDKLQSLIGYGVVVIDGDLTVTADTNTNFDGILYVTGKIDIDRSGVFRGTIIAGESIEVHGHLPVVASAKSRKTKKTKKTGKTLKSRAKTKKTNKTKKTKKTWKSLKIVVEESVYISHDPDMVDALVAELGRYRRWKSSYRPVPTGEDGRPDEYHKGGGRTMRTYDAPPAAGGGG